MEEKIRDAKEERALYSMGLFRMKIMMYRAESALVLDRLHIKNGGWW